MALKKIWLSLDDQHHYPEEMTPRGWCFVGVGWGEPPDYFSAERDFGRVGYILRRHPEQLVMRISPRSVTLTF